MAAGLDFYYWPTPNGWKVSILLEELGIPYRLNLLDIGNGEQFEPAFAKLSPNKRIPAIVDHDVEGSSVSVFESGAILLYLARKHGRFLPAEPYAEKHLLEWMFWQSANLGPMAGQHSHFWNYAPDGEKTGYAASRYRAEYVRCIEVLDEWLQDRPFVLGTYTIADMMCWPWLLIAKAMGVDLEPYQNVSRWRLAVKDRPAVRRGVDLAKTMERRGPIDKKTRNHLFGRHTNPNSAQTG